MEMLPTMEIIVPSMQPSTNVPAFLAKLWKMVDDPGTDDMISWSAEGNSFVIHNQTTFAQTLLPYYYKHSNMSSFVRQLNMYDFHKVVGVESGGLKSEKQEEMEFQHQFFIRTREDLLDRIKRKVSSKAAAQYAPAIKTEKVNEVLNEVSIIKDKQENLDTKLDTMKKENEALWREVVNLRTKHQNQQKIVNKLIQFLVSMVQPRMSGAVKRRFASQLAIQDVFDGEGGGPSPSVGGPSNSKEIKLDASGAASADPGPIIRDVTNETQQQIPNMQALLAQATGNTSGVSIELPETPEPQPPSAVSPQTFLRASSPVAPAMRAVDPSLVNPSIMPTATAGLEANKPSTSGALTPVISPGRPKLHREISKEDLDLEMNFMQKDLENLRELMSGQITLESNLISSLFSPDDPLPNLVYSSTAGAASDGAGASAEATPQLQLQLDNNGANSRTVDTGPSLFELADMDDDNAANASSSAATRSAEDPMSSLNTPLVFADNTNPLISHFNKK